VSMTIGIATATSQVGVALSGPDGPIAALHIHQGRRHAELLAPAIDTLTRMTGVELSAVSLVAVDVGPGLFTGMRVGIATAKALASALRVPLVGCTSLDLLAHPHRFNGRSVVSVVDARRGEVFWAVYRSGGDGMIAITEAAVTSPAELAAAVAGATSAADTDLVLATGDGARRYATELSDVVGLELAGREYDHPSAAVLAELAASRPALPPEQVMACYLRGPDVRIGWAARPGTAPVPETARG
jgi:tRNA threonylcarbamoyladenosine biosynthesis protein TsaB